MRRRIAAVTGTRAEYGLLVPVLREIRRRRRLELDLLVTGQHLMPGFGRTVCAIEADGFPIAARIPLGLRGDRPQDIARALGLGVLGFARAYRRLQPDLVLVLGDRYEILAAAAAALPFGIPVAHIHGGEATEGVIDEQSRHAITKLSHLHFPVTASYRRRILRMGEDPRRVFCFGAPGLDHLAGARLLGRRELLARLGLPRDRRLGVVTLHPGTLDPEASGLHGRELVRALRRFPEVFWVVTLPNADTGCRAIIRELRAFVRSRPGGAILRPSLGTELYLSLLKHADLMAGNSSSGLLEAPSFRLPVVNIGDRQAGRLRAANVIDVPRFQAFAIADAIRRALSPRFRRSLAEVRNPYHGRNSPRRIAEALEKAPLGPGILKKRFFDTSC